MGGSASRGFTLIEVLVALAIAAIALAAVSRSAAVSSASATEIKLRALAGFVAENRLGELDARHAWPPVGVSEGLERQADIDFPWRMHWKIRPRPATNKRSFIKSCIRKTHQ